MAGFGKGDEIAIEILEDGTIKSSTDPISGANHGNAEQFLRYMGTLGGGETSIKKKAGHAHHHHHHGEGEKAGHKH